MDTYYCTLLHINRFISSFDSESLVFLCLFLQNSFARRCACAHCLLCFPEREILLKTEILFWH